MHEDLDAVPMTIRTEKASLVSGDPIEVELGARWVTNSLRQERTRGIWVQCEVISDHGREILVKLIQ
jgi:hypothetical protein